MLFVKVEACKLLSGLNVFASMRFVKQEERIYLFVNTGYFFLSSNPPCSPVLKSLDAVRSTVPYAKFTSDCPSSYGSSPFIGWPFYKDLSTGLQGGFAR